MKALVVLPTYNEAENLAPLAQEIFANTPENTELLIIDDNSPDGTGKIADQMAHKNPCVIAMHRPKKMGLGSAYVLAYQWALARPYDIMIQMDCDFSHDPKDLPRLIDALAETDLVIGSRYVSGGSIENWPWVRSLISQAGNFYASAILGLGIKDMTGGFKAFRRKVIETMDLGTLVSDGYAFQIETTYHTLKNGFKVREIPIIFKDRTRGQSKISKRIIWEAIFSVWRLRFKKILETLLLCLSIVMILHYYFYFFTNHYLPNFLPGFMKKLGL